MFLMLMLLGVVVFFTHYRKNKYYFVRFVLPPRRYFEVFDNLPHFDNGSCVCTLFLLTFYYFCEILHLLLLYRQWRSVVVMCSGVCEIETVFVFVVESWTIAVNLDGILLF